MKLMFLVSAILLSAFNVFADAPAPRDQVSLNGNWPVGGTVPRYDSQNVQIDVKTFERDVTVPSDWTNKRYFLEFNAVNYSCDVYVNDNKVGSHIGAWIPFKFDITSRVNAGQKFRLKVVVRGKLQAPNTVGGKARYWIGHNDFDKKRSGIVDDVFLRAYGKAYIEDVFVKTFTRSKEIEVKYTVVNKTGGSWTGKAVSDIVRESSGKKEQGIGTGTFTLKNGEKKTFKVRKSWTNAAYWWPDRPEMYLLMSRLENGSGTIDRQTERFGFKEFWIVGTQFRLNGIRVNLRGDWCAYSQYWGAIRDRQTLRNHLVQMKKTNANIMRWHKHMPPQFVLDACDEMGIMVLSESPVYGRPYLRNDIQEEFINNCVKLIPAWVKSTRNHASVVMWSASNEATYNHLSKFPPHLLEKLGKKIYEIDDNYRPVNYDGDVNVPGVIYNKHYVEGYERNPVGNSYTAWGNHIHNSKPTYYGEILAVRPGKNDNGWWIGVWPRGLRYQNVAGIAPRVYYGGSRINDAQEKLQALAYNPIALFDKAYDGLGIGPHKDGNFPSVKEGANISRNLVLYNDDYRDSKVNVKVEVKVDGSLYAGGTGDYDLSLGAHKDIQASFQVPKRNGKIMQVTYITTKAGKERFRETLKFRISDDGKSGGSNGTVTLSGQASTNNPPQLNFKTPGNNAQFIAGQTINVDVAASDSDGSIAQVDLYVNNKFLRTEFSAPYTWGANSSDGALRNVSAGTYNIKAVAKDNKGKTSEKSISVTVVSPNQAPNVNFATPGNNSSFNEGKNLYIKVNASDADGSINNVKLYLNNNFIRQENFDPYEWGNNDNQLKNLKSGSYTLKAVATDNKGKTTTKSISFSVKKNMTLPSGWSSKQFGNSNFTAQFENGVYTLEAAGRDIWDKSDEFGFSYKPWNGDCSLVVRVNSLTNTNEWAKAGLMIRETLDANSAHAMVVVTPERGVSLQRRFNPGQISHSTTYPGVKAAEWLRLVRSGNVIRAYFSNDADTWHPLGTTTVTMHTNVYVGLAVTSHNPGTITVAKFSNYSVKDPLDELIVDRFMLVNADNGQDIRELKHGDTVDLTKISSRISILVDPNQKPGSIQYLLNGSHKKYESSAPYCINSDGGGTNYFAWNPPSGQTSISVIPWSKSGGSGVRGEELKIKLNFIK